MKIWHSTSLLTAKTFFRYISIFSSESPVIYVDLINKRD